MKNLQKFLYLAICTCFVTMSMISCETESEELSADQESSTQLQVIENKTLSYDHLSDYKQVKTKLDLVAQAPATYLEDNTLNLQGGIGYLKTSKGELFQLPLFSQDGAASNLSLTFQIEEGTVRTFLVDNNGELNSRSILPATNAKGAVEEPCVPVIVPIKQCEWVWMLQNTQTFCNPEGVPDPLEEPVCTPRWYCYTYTDVRCP